MDDLTSTNGTEEAGNVKQPPEPADDKVSYLTAEDKINAELKSFSGGSKEKVISKHVAKTLLDFCRQHDRFAYVVLHTRRTLSDCCAEIMYGCGNAISDIEVYKRAAKFYFPNADIQFQMQIALNGEAPSEEEMRKTAPKPKAPPVRKQASSKAAVKPASTAAGGSKPKEQKPEWDVIQLSLWG